MDAPRATTIGAAVAALLATVALVGLRSCGEPELRASAPAIAAASDRYTVAWMRPARHGGALVVQQFARDTLEPLGPPHPVIERKDLRTFGVELVAMGDGYVAFSRVEDPEKKPNWATQLVAVPLDRDGNPSGDETIFGASDYACHGAGAMGDRAVLGYVEIARSHRYPQDTLGLLVVDRQGGYLGSRAIASNVSSCATAIHGRELAVAWTRWVATGSGGYAARLAVALEEPYRDGRDQSFAVPVGDIASSPVRVVPRGDGWAILYNDREDRLHVAFVDTHGALLGTRELPPIDGDTVDLATNGRGIFVTWVDGGRVRSLGIDGGSPRNVKPSGARASRTRALGDTASCVVAWTVGRGRRMRARIAKSAACP